MSAFPDSEIGGSVVRSWGLTQAQFAALATTVVVIGLSTICSQCEPWVDDPAIGIEWPLEGEPTLSEKDRTGLLLGEAETYPSSERL